jgi:hypothetical protein
MTGKRSAKAADKRSALDPLTREMLYLAPSSTAAARASQAMARPRAKAGMIEAMFSELMGVVGMAKGQPARERLPRPDRQGVPVRPCRLRSRPY